MLTKRMAVSPASIAASAKLDEVLRAYQWHDHQHAIAILTIDFPQLLSEICDVLLAFRIDIDWIKTAGGNESQIPKALSQSLRPLGWQERKLRARLLVDEEEVSSDTHGSTT